MGGDLPPMSVTQKQNKMSTILKPTQTAEGNAQVSNLTRSQRLPKDNYIVRCKKSTAEVSKTSGKPMIKMVWEIARPDSIEINGKPTAIAGIELKPNYLVCHTDPADAKKNERLFNTQVMFGIEPGVDVDDLEPYAKAFEGKVANAICGAEEYVQRKDLTDAEIAAGKTPQEAEPIRMEDGTEVKGYNCVLIQLLEASSVQLPPRNEVM